MSLLSYVERVKPVPEDRSYATIGNYNGQTVAQQAKGK